MKLAKAQNIKIWHASTPLNLLRNLEFDGVGSKYFKKVIAIYFSFVTLTAPLRP